MVSDSKRPKSIKASRKHSVPGTRRRSHSRAGGKQWRVCTAAGPTGGHDDEPGGERHEEQEDREAVPLGTERDKHHADHVQHKVHFTMAPKTQHAQVHFGNNQDGSPDGQKGKKKVAELENVIWQHAN